MTRREKLLKDYLSNSEEAIASLNKDGIYQFDRGYVWQILIYELEHYDIPSDVLHHNLSAQEIIFIVQSYISENGIPVGAVDAKKLTGISHGNKSLIKAHIKSNGELWIIHKNDKDTFPSQPHAHNYDRQLKLHLGTGELFRKKANMGNIGNKELLLIRGLVEKKIEGIILPALAY